METHTIHEKDDSVLPVTSTSIATTLLSGGRTAHSVFKITVLLNTTSTCDIKPNSKEAQILLKCLLIIWDEAPMTYSHAFVAASTLLCYMTKF